MPHRRESPVSQFIRRVAEAQYAAYLPDGALLEGFLTRRDEAAFEALVRRHGPMVLRLCRRILGNEQDAEDAFQATFLVLTRTGTSLRPYKSLGGWLYGVAYRIAQKARIAAARRRKHEGHIAGGRVDDLLAQLTVREAHEFLAHELARLPDKFRTPIVLCYLEGLSRDEAAHRLGWSSSTLKSRLEQARERLRRRLASRGLALSAGLGASLFCERTSAAGLPSALVGSTVEAATAVAVGGSVASAVSAQVTALTQGAVVAMSVSKLKVPLAALLAGSVLAVGGGIWMQQSAAAKQPSNDQPSRPAVQPPVAEKETPRGKVEPAKKDGQPEKKQQDILQGTWLVTKTESGGIEYPGQLGIKWVFRDGKLTTFLEVKKTEEGTVRLDPMKSPMQIDTRATFSADEGQDKEIKGQTVKGIFSLEGNELKVAVGEPGGERPETFSTNKESKNRVLYLKRSE